MLEFAVDLDKVRELKAVEKDVDILRRGAIYTLVFDIDGFKGRNLGIPFQKLVNPVSSYVLFVV